MSSKIVNFFYHALHYFRPNKKRNINISQVNNINNLLPVPRSLREQIKNIPITEIIPAINFVGKHFKLPERFYFRKNCDTRIENLSYNNQKIVLNINNKIESYFDSDFISDKKIIHNRDELISELNYQISMQNNDNFIKTENNELSIVKSKKSKSCFHQIGIDLNRMNIKVKINKNKAIRLNEINDLNEKFYHIPPSHISHICNTANQSHLANAYFEVVGMIKNNNDEYLSQKENSSSILIEVLEANHYQVTSECVFNLINIKTNNPIRNTEIATKTITKFKIDDIGNLTPEINDRLIIDIKMETNPEGK